jgi:predicted alpha/beta-hydrolase family hydrolase
MLSTTTGIAVPHRSAPLTLHKFWPATGEPLQTVLFSHGDGLSPSDYVPLLHDWVGQGIAVLAPDHRGATLCPLWLARVLDMQAAAGHLPATDAPLRLAGHSFGAHTVSLLLGATPSQVTGQTILALPRTDAGLLLTPPGDGRPASLAPAWLDRAPYLQLDLAGLRIPSLIIAGGRDASPIIRPGWRWGADGLSLGPPVGKYLGVAPAGDHYLGGIATGRGTPDPALLADIAAITADYLLYGPAWTPPVRPMDHLSFTTYLGMHPAKGNPP